LGSDLVKKETTIPCVLYSVDDGRGAKRGEKESSLLIRQVFEKWYQNVRLTHFSWAHSLMANKSRRLRWVGHLPVHSQILIGKILK
jgi:hypothetical protein